ncbi:hypothetical protein PanWU01x14_281680 [Parasponia andersonii]|uniref:Uncharacterized protein n=1 Tax=Parasponia andersonii TaxID=3476 RepID=A0A2P5B0S0_PARAD|nr:hypothetical protein PanWU01x14_281680 [Parasponia andersonii]
MGSQGAVERSLGGSRTNSRPSIAHFPRREDSIAADFAAFRCRNSRRRATAAAELHVPPLGNAAVRRLGAPVGRHARLVLRWALRRERRAEKRERDDRGGENERETVRVSEREAEIG